MQLNKLQQQMVYKMQANQIKKTVKKRKHQGFTIVELMIAIVIGGLVLLSLLTIFFSMQQAQKNQTGISDIRDNSFIMQERLDYLLKHAGYSEFNENIININNGLSAPILVNLNNQLGNQTTYTATTNAQSDAIAIQMQTPFTANEMLGCIGGFLNNSTATNTPVVNFFIHLDAQNNLQCRENGGGFVNIASNVIRLRFYYKLSDNSNQCIGNWQRSNAISDFSKVCAIYYAMVIKSPANQSTLTAQTNAFDLSPMQDNNQQDRVILQPENGTNGKLMPTGRLIRKIIHLRN